MRTRIVFIFGWMLLAVLCAAGQTKSIECSKNETSVTYLLSHPLHHMESTSKEIDCHIEIDPAKKEIKTVSAQIDVMTFNSGNSNRDSHAMEVIDAITYPDVMFSSTSIVQNGDSLIATGKLTFHGVTKNIVIAAATKWSPNRLEVNGSFDLSLTDFKVERPSLLGIKCDDTLKFSLIAIFKLE
ncbi:MAG: YceI family protein [Bacteroidota bacterium]|jgi:polyisoprenoid-binding protein YceI